MFHHGKLVAFAEAHGYAYDPENQVVRRGPKDHHSVVSMRRVAEVVGYERLSVVLQLGGVSTFEWYALNIRRTPDCRA